MRLDHRARVEDRHRRRFERLLGAALRRLPPGFEQYLDNVAFLVADDPTPEQRAASQLQPDETLYGLYEGTPRINRGIVGPLVPDRITIFRHPIEAEFSSDKEITEEIRRTIIHEVAHHCGFEEDQLPF